MSNHASDRASSQTVPPSQPPVYLNLKPRPEQAVNPDARRQQEQAQQQLQQ